MSEVTDLIGELRAGTKTLDEVAQRFRERVWPGRPHAKDADELWKRSDEDPEPDVEGSFDEVEIAAQLGHISDDEYRVLRRAVLEGFGIEDR